MVQSWRPLASGSTTGSLNLISCLRTTAHPRLQDVVCSRWRCAEVVPISEAIMCNHTGHALEASCTIYIEPQYTSTSYLDSLFYPPSAFNHFLVRLSHFSKQATKVQPHPPHRHKSRQPQLRGTLDWPTLAGLR